MAKLNWERANKETTIATKGSVRTSIMRFSAIPPTDKAVERLHKIGYSGKRPPTRGALSKLLKEWAPEWSGIKPRQMVRLRSLGGEERRNEARRLLTKLEERYSEKAQHIDARTAKGKTRMRTRIRFEYERFSAELGRLCR